MNSVEHSMHWKSDRGRAFSLEDDARVCTMALVCFQTGLLVAAFSLHSSMVSGRSSRHAFQFVLVPMLLALIGRIVEHKIGGIEWPTGDVYLP